MQFNCAAASCSQERETRPNFASPFALGTHAQSNRCVATQAVKLEGVDARSFETILNFIYTSQVVVEDVTELLHLLVASEHLDVHAVRDLCVQRLQQRLDLPNALQARIPLLPWQHASSPPLHHNRNVRAHWHSDATSATTRRCGSSRRRWDALSLKMRPRRLCGGSFPRLWRPEMTFCRSIASSSARSSVPTSFASTQRRRYSTLS